MTGPGVSTVHGGPDAANGLPHEILRVVEVDGQRVQATYRLWWTRKLGPVDPTGEITP